MSHEIWAILILVFILGVIVGGIIMFFVARKNPEWVQEMYQKQKNTTRSVLSPVEEKLAEAQKKLDELELDKKIEAKVKELMGK